MFVNRSNFDVCQRILVGGFDGCFYLAKVSFLALQLLICFDGFCLVFDGFICSEGHLFREFLEESFSVFLCIFLYFLKIESCIATFCFYLCCC